MKHSNVDVTAKAIVDFKLFLLSMLHNQQYSFVVLNPKQNSDEAYLRAKTDPHSHPFETVVFKLKSLNEKGKFSGTITNRTQNGESQECVFEVSGTYYIESTVNNIVSLQMGVTSGNEEFMPELVELKEAVKA